MQTAFWRHHPGRTPQRPRSVGSLSAPNIYRRQQHTIKKCTEPEPFLDAAQRQLAQLGIAAGLAFPRDGGRTYTADAAVDPMGPTGAGAPRVCRGGSLGPL